jgi:hypothetical protein
MYLLCKSKEAYCGVLLLKELTDTCGTIDNFTFISMTIFHILLIMFLNTHSMVVYYTIKCYSKFVYVCTTIASLWKPSLRLMHHHNRYTDRFTAEELTRTTTNNGVFYTGINQFKYSIKKNIIRNVHCQMIRIF